VRTHLRTLLVSVLAIALVGWFLRHANLSEIARAVRGARLLPIAGTLTLLLFTYWARVVRWRYLLAPLGSTRFGVAMRTTIIGFAASMLLPARAGDVIRPYLLARRENLSPSATFATIVVERVLDLIAVLVLLAWYVWGVGASSIPPTLLRPVQASAALAAAAAAVLMLLMWVLAHHPERVGNIVRGLNRVLPHRIADALGGVAHRFSEGLAVAKTPRPLVMALLWSFPIWIFIAMEAWLVTIAFGINMSMTGSYLLQALLVIGVAVPTPGAVGGFHEAYRIGVTTFFGAPNDAAVAAAIVLHAISFLPVTFVGVFLMASEGLSLGRLSGISGEARSVDAAPPSSGRNDNHPESETDEVPVLRPSGR
jgi:glycosyltransferase 2 family protein